MSPHLRSAVYLLSVLVSAVLIFLLALNWNRPEEKFQIPAAAGARP